MQQLLEAPKRKEQLKLLPSDGLSTPTDPVVHEGLLPQAEGLLDEFTHPADASPEDTKRRKMLADEVAKHAAHAVHHFH
jgi:hypothetical protein